MKSAYLACACLAASLLAAAPSEAGMLYSDGPINGNNNAYYVAGPFATFDSFTLSSGSTLSSVSNAGLWVLSGDALQSISWEITNANGNVVLASGTSNITASLVGTNGQGADVYNASFALPNINLGKGTYYLGLFDGTTANGGPVGWDENDGPSNAFACLFIYCGSVGSESFQINGSVAVPEPATLSLIGAGLMGAATFRRKKRA